MKFDIAIMGLGYVGLPLAVAASKSGLAVLGIDVSSDKIRRLNAGYSHIDDVPDADIQRVLTSGGAFSTNESVLSEAKAVVICVPTPLSADGGPDLSAVIAATESISRNLVPGHLIVLESTTYPGTTQSLLQPLLECSGFKCGVDFFLAFSPERIDPGNRKFGVTDTPKIVGGCDPASTESACALYSRFVQTVVPVTSAREAEMAKLLENTYRHINIALVNEMAKFCHDMSIDLWEVIDAASTKPYGFEAFYPGPGVGGHCIPIDPNYLSHQVRRQLGYPFRFVELAQEINDSMPRHVAERAVRILSTELESIAGSSILLLGVTYKKNVSDTRESPAIDVARELDSLGVHVSAADPLASKSDMIVGPWRHELNPEQNIGNYDLAILLQAHGCFDIPRLADSSRRFFDTRGVTFESSSKHYRL